MAPPPERKAPTKKSRSKGDGVSLAYSGECLRLTGYFNRWSTSDPKSCFQPVKLNGQRGGREERATGVLGSVDDAPPVWRLTACLQDGFLSFQVLSGSHLFGYRVFPAEVCGCGFSRLVRGEPSAVLATVGGHGHGHGRNFFIEEPPGAIVTIYAEVAKGRVVDPDIPGEGVAVWYALEAATGQSPDSLPLLKQDASKEKPGMPCRQRWLNKASARCAQRCIPDRLELEPEIEWARCMLDEFIDEYVKQGFQEELRRAWDREGRRYRKETRRREVCLKYQLPIIAKYGFPESFQGVLQAYSAFPMYDFEVHYKDLLLKWLIDPDAQASQPLSSDKDSESGLVAAVQRCKKEIERSVGRAPALPAPLRGGVDAASTARLVHVRLPWAESPPTLAPLVCAVVEDLLSPREADTLKAWIEVRCSWKPSNGHLICRINDSILAHELWMRLQRLLPAECGGKPVAGLSEHLRFLRYGPGHRFLPHEDSMQTVSASGNAPSRRSLLSALLYLSDPEGASARGGTRFVAPDCPECARSGRCEAACGLCVDAPVRKGSLLLFAQSVTHAGTEPLEVEKLAIRTDVMYFDSHPGGPVGPHGHLGAT